MKNGSSWAVLWFLGAITCITWGNFSCLARSEGIRERRANVRPPSWIHCPKRCPNLGPWQAWLPGWRSDEEPFFSGCWRNMLLPTCCMVVCQEFQDCLGYNDVDNKIPERIPSAAITLALEGCGKRYKDALVSNHRTLLSEPGER